MVTVVGKDPAKIYRCTCHSCASILEYTVNETITSYVRDWDGGGEQIRTLRCPACGTEIRVSFYPK